MLLSVMVFMPDMDHAGEGVIAYEIGDCGHEDAWQRDVETKHCNSGVSCAGATEIRGFAILAMVSRLAETSVLKAQFDIDGLAPEHEPPVPILIA